MLEMFLDLPLWQQALIATVFTWTMTGVGASFVFFTKDVNEKFLNIMLGFAGGIMIAASFWSLLEPAIGMSEDHAIGPWFPVAVGFLLGGVLIYFFDKLIPHIHISSGKKEGLNPEKRRRSTLLVFAMTFHNIPEGLAIGVALGAAFAQNDTALAVGALTLALGIGFQNIPEGTAVAMPLRGEGLSRRKSFFFGWMSGIVEPISAMIGILLIAFMTPILPYALAVAAGAMIFVVVEEVIPSTQRYGYADIAAIALMVGFTLMMILDVALG